jgi:hypothetical protein
MLFGVKWGWAQWDEYVPLTADSFIYSYNPRFAIDEQLRIHVFAVRGLDPFDIQPNCLTYMRFNASGEPLGEPFVMFTDSQRSDFDGAVLRDRDNNIRVIWGRWYDPPHAFREIILYAKFTAEGTLLDGPTELWQPEPTDAGGDNPQLVQTPNGTLWYTDGFRFAGYDEAMNPISPMRAIFGPDTNCIHAQLAIHPLGSVWITVRVFPGGLQFVGMKRVDIDNAPLEVIVENTPQELQADIASVVIDSGGAFHHIVYREDIGVYYRRDARDGSAIDTLELELSPDGGGTKLAWGGGDTLMIIWLAGNPGEMHRHIIGTNGQRLQPPQVIPLTGNELIFYGAIPHVWYRGSHWIVGYSPIRVAFTSDIAMIHLPGEFELPVSDDSRESPPSFGQHQLTVYPQPVSDRFHLDISRTLLSDRIEVEIYNLLGQRVITLPLFAVGRDHFAAELPISLSTGVYFVSLQTISGLATAKIIIQR